MSLRFEGVPAEKDEKDEKAADAEGEEKKDDADGARSFGWLRLRLRTATAARGERPPAERNC